MSAHHGHNCKWVHRTTKNVRGQLPGCIKCSSASYISLQCCGRRLCSGTFGCWAALCNSRGWDAELSACANKIADGHGLTLRERAAINQYNISNILGLPAAKQYNHVSVGRRKREPDGDEISDVESVSEESSGDEYVPHTKAKTSSARDKRRKYVGADDSENSDDRDFIVGNDVVEYETSKKRKRTEIISISSSSSSSSSTESVD